LTFAFVLSCSLFPVLRYSRTVLRCASAADEQNVTTSKRIFLIFALAVTLGVPALAVTPGYENATLLNAVEAQDQQVFWQFTFRVRDQVLIADFRPLIPWNFTLLQEFVICGPVKVRMGGKNVYLVRPGGKEIRLGVRLRIFQQRDPQLSFAAAAADDQCASPARIASFTKSLVQ
jgi:hypothetical protein